MKRLTVFVGSIALALLPPASARAAPGDALLGCGPAGDVAEPTGLALVDDLAGAPVIDEAAPVASSEDLAPQGSDVDSISDHDIELVLGTVLVVLIIAILL